MSDDSLEFLETVGQQKTKTSLICEYYFDSKMKCGKPAEFIIKYEDYDGMQTMPVCKKCMQMYRKRMSDEIEIDSITRIDS